MAPQFNKAQVALQNANTAATIQNMIANTNKTKEETRKIAFQADIGEAGSNIVDFVLDQTEKGMTNARDISENYFRRDNWFNPDNYTRFFESIIPRNERNPAAIRADRRFGRKSANEKRKIQLPKSKHPRTNRRVR
jgi:hypothetical protein